MVSKPITMTVLNPSHKAWLLFPYGKPSSRDLRVIFCQWVEGPGHPRPPPADSLPFQALQREVVFLSFPTQKNPGPYMQIDPTFFRVMQTKGREVAIKPQKKTSPSYTFLPRQYMSCIYLIKRHHLGDSSWTKVSSCVHLLRGVQALSTLSFFFLACPLTGSILYSHLLSYPSKAWKI